MERVTRILGEIARSDPAAAGQLLPLVYEELRRMAGQMLAGERVDHTLQATALVHEAYLRLLGPGGAPINWENRAHFFSAAAEAMRRVLVDHARRRNALRRGAGRPPVSLDEDQGVQASSDATRADADELLAVDAALGKLAAEDPQAAELVKLRYFAGLGMAEAAAVLGISRATASRRWTYARAWLRHEIKAALLPHGGRHGATGTDS